MSRTVLQVKTRVKSILQDKVDPRRYPDEDIINALNDALVECRRMRPDLFVNNKKPFTVPQLVEDTNLIPIEDQFFNSVVFFTVGYLMLRDTETAVDGFAMGMLNRATNQLVSR